MFKFNDSRSYKKFIKQRDEALENIFKNHSLRITDILDIYFFEVLFTVQHKYPGLINNAMNRTMISMINDHLNIGSMQVIDKLVYNQKQMRKLSYVLAHAGESYAVSQIIGKEEYPKLTRQKIDEFVNRPSSSGISLRDQYKSFFLKVKRDTIHAMELSAMFNEDIDKALGRVFLRFPKKKAFPKSPKLRKVRTTESDSGINYGFKGGQSFEYDPTTWKEILDEYENEYIPVDRSPESFFNLRDPFSDQPIAEEVKESDKLYSWELEKEINHDFVQSVRSGQVEAANQNGIDDFVWISVLDQKTCEQCCVWRNGLLTSEIEKELDNNQDLREYCDAIVPPAHFNCRCSLAPASSDLEAEDTSSVEKEFNDWLNDTTS